MDTIQSVKIARYTRLYLTAVKRANRKRKKALKKRKKSRNRLLCVCLRFSYLFHVIAKKNISNNNSNFESYSCWWCKRRKSNIFSFACAPPLLTVVSNYRASCDSYRFFPEIITHTHTRVHTYTKEKSSLHSFCLLIGKFYSFALPFATQYRS